jgi:hypothetical protein
MSVQTLYDQYLCKLSSKEQLELIQLLAVALQEDTEKTDAITSDDKIRLAKILSAEAAEQQWKALSEELPDSDELTMDEIVEEVRKVRVTH